MSRFFVGFLGGIGCQNGLLNQPSFEANFGPGPIRYRSNFCAENWMELDNETGVSFDRFRRPISGRDRVAVRGFFD